MRSIAASGLFLAALQIPLRGTNPTLPHYGVAFPGNRIALEVFAQGDGSFSGLGVLIGHELGSKFAAAGGRLNNPPASDPASLLYA
jgi:hypothetical protein